MNISVNKQQWEAMKAENLKLKNELKDLKEDVTSFVFWVEKCFEELKVRQIIAKLDKKKENIDTNDIMDCLNELINLKGNIPAIMGLASTGRFKELENYLKFDTEKVRKYWEEIEPLINKLEQNGK